MYSVADLFRRLFEYEQHSQRKVLAALEAVSPEVASSASYQQCLDLMGHLFAARRIWLWRIGAIASRPETNFPKDVRLADLQQDIGDLQQIWGEYLARLDDQELERVVSYKTLDGREFQNRVDEILTQLHGHSPYHLGQISARLRQAGAEPALTDYILWAREKQG